MLQHIIVHLSQYLSSCQQGFFQGRSTVTQLLGFLHRIGKAHDRGRRSGIIYLDFAKAFDNPYYITTVSFRLSPERGSQRLCVSTNFCLVWCSKGSLLDPLLFLTYIYSLPFVISQRSNITLWFIREHSKRPIRQYDSSRFILGLKPGTSVSTQPSAKPSLSPTNWTQPSEFLCTHSNGH